jgi:hypothetical protein
MGSDTLVGETIHPLLEQVRQAAAVGLYLPALMSAMAIPDILGALSAPNGQASGARYKAFLTTYLGVPEPEAALLYNFRCSLIHQGTSYKVYDHPIVFQVPSPKSHGIVVDTSTVDLGDGKVHRIYNLPAFVDRMASAGRQWAEHHVSDSIVLQNIERFVRVMPTGLERIVVGVTVIS